MECTTAVSDMYRFSIPEGVVITITYMSSTCGNTTSMAIRVSWHAAVVSLIVSNETDVTLHLETNVDKPVTV